jgi:hypothetical protein
MDNNNNENHKEYNEKEQLISLTVANKKIINNIKLSLAIYMKKNNFIHNSIDTILKNEILQNSK